MPPRAVAAFSTRTFPLLSGLNTAQREAVTTTKGPVLVLAGAGTGKTRVITYRIAHLLDQGVPGSAILAVTFTNKAAREMRERVSHLLGKAPDGLTLSTFHSLGARLLRAEAGLLGYRPGFSIFDESDQISVLRTALKDIRGARAAASTRAVHAAISRAKNGFLLPEDLAAQATDDWDHLVSAAYQRYQETLRAMNAMDFDDLILLPVILLERDEAAARRYRSRFRHILVDEYQDTNAAQYRFLRSLVGPERNICVVGDDDQSIYGFRGAQIEKILGFERDFPGARVVKLEENYRSTSSILSLANAVIASSPGRHTKTLRSTRGEGTKARWVTASTDALEVDHVVSEIQGMLLRRVPARSIAILIRAAIQARPFEEKLRLRRIPYTLIGGQSYFDRKEIRDVLAYLKAVANPRDDVSLLRILNVPARGLGNTTIQKLGDLAHSSRIPIQEALRLVRDGEGDFQKAARAAAGHVADLFARAAERLSLRQHAAMARGLIEETRYIEAVQELYPDPLARQGRWAAVEDLLASIERWEREDPRGDFADFLEAVTLDGQDPRGDKEERLRGITIMTLHSAKGLEFPHVYLVGVEDDMLPHRKAQAEGEKAVDEERRLFYVGITRAQDTLTVTTARARTSYGQERPASPSRFLLEVQGSGLLDLEESQPDTPPSEEDVGQFLEMYKSLRNRKR